MVDAGARAKCRAPYDIPAIAIFSRVTDLTQQPITIFEVTVTAGDDAGAALTVRTRVDGVPLICLHARAGSVARFVPAAPALIRDSLQIDVSGADAVGSFAYR